MRRGTLAHVSDLHLGRNAQTDEAARALAVALLSHGVDHVVVTGDVTHRGRRSELARFRAAFAPLLEDRRVTIVPGNHDRLGDDVADELCDTGHVALTVSARVRVRTAPGLRLVCFDSTGPHNRSWLRSHGRLTERDVAAVAQACDAARAGELVALLLHHHVLPLPPDRPAERVPRLLGLNFTCELAMGQALLDAIGGRCDLVLHGHRHTPARRTLLKQGARPLRVYNAGSSTELGDVRLFTHAEGRLLGPPVWLSADEAFAAAGDWAAIAGTPFVAA